MPWVYKIKRIHTLSVNGVYDNMAISWPYLSYTHNGVDKRVNMYTWMTEFPESEIGEFIESNFVNRLADNGINIVQTPRYHPIDYIISSEDKVYFIENKVRSRQINRRLSNLAEKTQLSERDYWELYGLGIINKGTHKEIQARYKKKKPFYLTLFVFQLSPVVMHMYILSMDNDPNATETEMENALRASSSGGQIVRQMSMDPPAKKPKRE